MTATLTQKRRKPREHCAPPDSLGGTSDFLRPNTKDTVVTPIYANPDPITASDFYDGVPSKRLVAWFIDLGVTAVLSAPLILPLFAIGVFLIAPLLLIPMVWTSVGFLYRWATISSRSATWGMRLMAIELRENDGARLSGGTALMHTLGTTVSFAFAFVQAVSIVCMGVTQTGQGVTDMILGTRMLNKEA